MKNVGVRVPQGGWHFTYLGGEEKIKTKVSSIKYTVPILIILFFFTSFMKNSDFYKNLKLHTEEIMRETALETDVDFYSIKRALKNPEKVETLRIFRRTEKFSKFPDEIFNFPLKISLK